ncbi:PIG-L family deacetylase [candidate division WWE3 bacterium]|nr:PIG-L family deacetylase [candidate division WWE3 bacterium]
MEDSYSKIFGNKQRILIVFAHPDDAEIYCGGTIARLTADGKEVRVVKVTSGNKGARGESISEKDLKALRENEDTQAMKILGIAPENNIYLNLGDGEILNDMRTIEPLVKQIRLFKPDLVITHNPENVIIKFNESDSWINHRDHRNTGMSVVDATYPYSRDLLFFPEQFQDKNITSHKVSEYLFVDSYNLSNEIFIDITSTVEIRTKALICHASQYSETYSKDTTDYFTVIEGSDRRWERFRYVVAD